MEGVGQPHGVHACGAEVPHQRGVGDHPGALKGITAGAGTYHSDLYELGGALAVGDSIGDDGATGSDSLTVNGTANGDSITAVTSKAAATPAKAMG